MGKPAPTDIPKKLESQSRAKGNLNPRPEAQQKREPPAPQPELLTKTPPGQNLPRQGRRDGGDNPVHGGGSSTENQRGLDTLSSTRDYIPLVLETKNVEDGGGTTGGSGESVTSTRREDEKGVAIPTGRKIGSIPRRAYQPTPVHLCLLSTQPGPDRRTYRPLERNAWHTNHDGDDMQMAGP